MKRMDFCNDWSFQKKGEEQYRLVDLPHDAMIEDTRSSASPSGASNAYFPGGVYIYEKSFSVPYDWADKHVEFQFEGVYRNAKVFINGKEAGGKPYGYIPFFVNTDGLLKYGENNTIRVEVDNSKVPRAGIRAAASTGQSGFGLAIKPVSLHKGYKFRRCRIALRAFELRLCTMMVMSLLKS